jgi:hypothetical protein
VRLEAKRCAQLGHCPRRRTTGQIERAQRRQHVGAIRGQLARPKPVPEADVEVAEQGLSEAEARLGARVTRREPDGLVQVLVGRGDLTPRQLHECQIDVGDRRSGRGFGHPR